MPPSGTAVLSVSSPRFDEGGGCSPLSALLAERGFSFDVTENETFVRGRRETGCRIHLPSSDAKRAWRAIRSAFPDDVSCAHVKLPHTEGCSSDVFSRSKCPSA